MSGGSNHEGQIKPVYREIGNVRTPLWWVGWRPVAMLLIGGFGGLAFGNATGIPVSLHLNIDARLWMFLTTVTGAVIGLVVWYWGTREINTKYKDVLDGFLKGVSAPDSEITSFTLISDGIGSRPFISPNKSYTATHIVIDESSANIYQGSLNMVEKRPELGNKSIEIPYEKMETVEYQDSNLVIRTTKGDKFEYTSTQKPDDLLENLKKRLDDY